MPCSLYNKVGYSYDNLDRVTEKKYNDVVKFKYTYDKFGRLSAKQDLVNNVTHNYRYDLIGRVTEVSTGLNSLNYTYDNFNRLSSTELRLDTNYISTEYVYGDVNNAGQKNGLIYGIKQNNQQTLSYTYDELSRLRYRTLNTVISFVTEYSFYDGAISNTTTTLLSSIKNGSDSLGYTYDNVGNIKTISENGTLKNTYHYDALNQLVREDNVGGNTVTYSYDNNGNILSKKTYQYIDPDTEITNQTCTEIVYGYGDSNWKDKMTEYNGQTITYDSIGNPLTYRNNISFTWGNGRQLQTFTQNDITTSYKYDDDGLRTQKNVNGIITEYYWLDGMLVGQKMGSNEYISFLYDENGKAYGMVYLYDYDNQGVYEIQYYYYVFNAQGDVIAIVDSYGDTVASYTYDSWGNIILNTGGIGDLNPLRYRGYYYDEETGLYYLQSRYYDPETGRFLNADNQITIGSDLTGTNLFAYCGNNPINRIDPTGEAWWHWAIGAAVVAACAVATVVTCGGFAAAVGAITAVGSGIAATTTASTIAAGAFIGSATVYGMSVLTAASNSNSVQEFFDQGSWGTVATTVLCGLSGAYDGYSMSKAQINKNPQNNEPFLPDEFYSKHAPKQSVPNSSYTNYTYNNYTSKYEKSTSYYDFAGRQTIRIDWTNHGYSNHGNPHIHYTAYNSQYRNGITIRWD